ncbi:MAG: BrnT family toxin [Gammaproteobacteria bacterium]|nr:BrnT family toxin [Gammaproteobacteria bacterium]NND40141.1 BrnT family toxin [Pseudomonadales bacterium]
MIEFEWDNAKSRANLRKHGVSFEEAQSVFYDDLAIQFDEDSVKHEDRFILLGISNLSRVLVVVHCERGPRGEVIRIISARKATVKEKRFYQGA